MVKEEGEKGFLERVIERRFKTYEEKCVEEIEFAEEALGKPHVMISIALPEGCEGLVEEFRRLPEDEEFINEVRNLVRRYLERKAAKLKAKQG